MGYLSSTVNNVCLLIYEYACLVVQLANPYYKCLCDKQSEQGQYTPAFVHNDL